MKIFDLQFDSPCVNSGVNSAIPSEIMIDLDNLPRVHACIVDMGAYEFQENRVFGDVDENCVIDLADYLDFKFCLERFGYERNPILDACKEVFDADGDEDVDLGRLRGIPASISGGMLSKFDSQPANVIGRSGSLGR